MFLIGFLLRADRLNIGLAMARLIDMRYFGACRNVELMSRCSQRYRQINVFLDSPMMARFRYSGGEAPSASHSSSGSSRLLHRRAPHGQHLARRRESVAPPMTSRSRGAQKRRTAIIARPYRESSGRIEGCLFIGVSNAIRGRWRATPPARLASRFYQ